MSLSSIKELVLATSTSEDGNMSTIKGDPKEALKNRKDFLNKLGISSSQTVFMHPVHGTRIIRAGAKDYNKPTTDEDGLITNESGVYLVLLTADCLPISIFDPKNKAIGIFHAGRVGLEKQIIDKAVQIMQSNFSSNPEDLLVNIGPSIGPCCYKPAFPEKSSDLLKRYIHKYDGKEYSIDLWTLAFDQLTEAGVLFKNIQNNKVCSCHDGRYFSYRKFVRDGLEDDFRFMTVLGIKP